MKRRILAILLCGALAMSLAACGSSESSDEKEEVREEETEKEQSEDEQAEESKSEQLIWCFESLAKQINLALMDEALRYVDDTGVKYEVVEPTDADLGTITTDDDENGCHLYVAFAPDDHGDDTICTVSYGNDHFSGSVDDMTHAVDAVYKTYNYNDESPNTEVENLDKVMEYIKSEMPKLIEEDK